MKIAISLALLISGSSCAGLSGVYGNETCGTGKTVYVNEGGKTGICLPENQVAFMMCVRELSYKESSVENALNMKAKIGELEAAVVKLAPETEVDFKNKLSKLWEGEGELA